MFKCLTNIFIQSMDNGGKEGMPTMCASEGEWGAEGNVKDRTNTHQCISWTLPAGLSTSMIYCPLSWASQVTGVPLGHESTPEGKTYHCSSMRTSSCQPAIKSHFRGEARAHQQLGVLPSMDKSPGHSAQIWTGLLRCQRTYRV